MKPQKKPLKIPYFRGHFFFQYCQLAQNQPKSHILLNKNGSMGDIYIMTLLNLLLTKTNVRHGYQNIIHYSMCLFLYIHQDTNTYIYLGRLNELPTSLGINAHFYLHRLKLITFFIVFYSVDKRLLICIGNRADKWKSIPILYLLTVVKLVRVHFFSPRIFERKYNFN